MQTDSPTNELYVIDGHADTAQRLLDEDYDLAAPLGDGNLNLAAAAAGNLGAQWFAAWVQPEIHRGRYRQRALELILAVHKQVIRHPEKLSLASSPAEILRARESGKLAVLLSIEGGHAIENSLAALRGYYRLGVRAMTLCWANSNGWADSSGDEDNPDVAHTADGLAQFGVEVVREMNRLGMMVDVAHLADRSFRRVLETSEAPVYSSHSCARSLCAAPRNLSDAMLRAVAERGGLLMVNFYSAFVSQSYRDAMLRQAPEVEAAVAALQARGARHDTEAGHRAIESLQRTYADRIPRPPLRELIDQIDHIARIAGIDHVGIGSDFDGVGGQLPEGMDSAADLPKIPAALRERGYSHADCCKVLSGNFLRYFGEVRACGDRLRTIDDFLD